MKNGQDLEEKASLMEKVCNGVIVTGLAWMISVGSCISMGAYHNSMADNYKTKAVKIGQMNTDNEVIPYKELAKTGGKYWALYDEHKQDAKDWRSYADKLTLKDMISKIGGGKK